MADGQYHKEAWDKLCHEIGWKRKGEYVSTQYDLGSPKGHLPKSIVEHLEMDNFNINNNCLFSRIQTCEI
jgi:hypothetical protein